MLKIVFFIISFCGYLASCVASEKYDLVICAIFRDEELYLKEWIEYHLRVGVDHFYLYNNLSCDNSMAILKPYVQSGIADVYDWPLETKSQEEYLTLLQVPAYNDALQIAKQTATWAAFVDLDEFIVPIHHDSIKDLLRDYKDIGGISINWQLFGTSNFEEIPSDKLLIETLIWKAFPEIAQNRYVKQIVQPKYVKMIKNAHSVLYYDGYFAMDTSGRKLPADELMQPINIKDVQINHYWLGTRQWFFKNKRKRRERWGMHVPESQIEAILSSSNDIVDENILRLFNFILH